MFLPGLKASKTCCQTVLFLCGTTHYLYYQQASLRYQQGCSIAQPALQKSNVIYQFLCHYDCRYVGRTTQKVNDRIKQNVAKSICSCSSSQKPLLPARRCKSSTQTINTQFRATDSAIVFIFYKILFVLNIMMTVDFLFLPKALLLSVNLL